MGECEIRPLKREGSCFLFGLGFDLMDIELNLDWAISIEPKEISAWAPFKKLCR
jgi:hypothetical protein